MDKQTLVRSLKRSADGAGLMNVKQFASFLGKHPNTVSRLVYGLECMKFGREKCFLVEDLAQLILDKRSM